MDTVQTDRHRASQARHVFCRRGNDAISSIQQRIVYNTSDCNDYKTPPHSSVLTLRTRPQGPGGPSRCLGSISPSGGIAGCGGWPGSPAREDMVPLTPPRINGCPTRGPGKGRRRVKRGWGTGGDGDG